MYLVDLVTAIWALVCLWIHTVLGHHRVHLPVQHSDAARFSRATMWVCWHVTTWVLALVCATLIAASMGHKPGCGWQGLWRSYDHGYRGAWGYPQTF